LETLDFIEEYLKKFRKQIRLPSLRGRISERTRRRCEGVVMGLGVVWRFEELPGLGAEMLILAVFLEGFEMLEVLKNNM
jgi:hypothetical protein